MWFQGWRKGDTTFYYCPLNLYGKSPCKVKNELLWRLLLKGIFFDNLILKDIDLIMSHIKFYKKWR